VDRVSADPSLLEIRVKRKAASGPVFGVIDQSPLERIHMHVVQLFNSLLQTPNMEIVEAALPEARQRIDADRKCQTQLSGRFSLLAAQAARDALFQNLNHGGRRSLGWFADQQVNVSRHDHVTDERKTVAVPNLAKNLNESIPGANRTQERYTPVTTEGDEMKVAAAVVANEFVGHESSDKSKPGPSKSERVGHPERQSPEKQNQFLSKDVQE